MALISCPNCGKPISPNATSCPHCGASLSPTEKEVKCPECGTSFPATNEVCPNCGEPNKAAQTMSLTGDKDVWPKLMFVPAVLAALGMLFALIDMVAAMAYYYHAYKNFVAVPFLVFFLYNILFSPKGSKLFIFSLVGAGLAATGMLAALVGWNVVVDLFYAGMAVMILMLPLVGKAKQLATICSAVMLGGWTLHLILYACHVYVGVGVVYAMIIAPATLALFLLLFFLSRKGRIF